VRGDLSTGTRVDVEMALIGGPPVSPEELLERYGPGLPSDYRPREQGVFGMPEFSTSRAGGASSWTATWRRLPGSLRTAIPCGRLRRAPRDQREKYLAIANLAEEMDRLGANELVFTTESWEASAVGPDDERAKLRPGEREDRTELMVTYGPTPPASSSSLTPSASRWNAP
jgi:hypothetical protein